MINKSDVTKLKTGMEQTKSDNFNLISNYMKSKAIKDYLNTYVDDVIKFKLHRNETFILESKANQFMQITAIMLFSILIFIVLGIMHIYTGVMMWASSLLLVCAAFTKYKYTAYLYSVNNVIRKL